MIRCINNFIEVTIICSVQVELVLSLEQPRVTAVTLKWMKELAYCRGFTDSAVLAIAIDEFLGMDVLNHARALKGIDEPILIEVSIAGLERK